MTKLTTNEIQKMRTVGTLAAQTLQMIAEHVRIGVQTQELDAIIYDYTLKHGAVPSPLGYHGYPKSCCISVNNVVCHGIPNDYVLRDGDIVNIDITSNLDGYHGDTSATFFVGTPSLEAQKVVNVARTALQIGIDVVKANVPIGDIGYAINEYVKSQGCSVVREYGGHGIGKAMHLKPFISHVGVRGAGARLVEGTCITIEPIINLGLPDIIALDDKWTVVTADSTLSAQFEHTLLITRNGCEVLTHRDAKLINSEID